MDDETARRERNYSNVEREIMKHGTPKERLEAKYRNLSRGDRERLEAAEPYLLSAEELEARAVRIAAQEVARFTKKPVSRAAFNESAPDGMSQAEYNRQWAHPEEKPDQ